MITGHKKFSLVILSLLLAVLLAGIVFTGCQSLGAVPQGWSGGVIDGGVLYIGSMDGRLVAANVTDGTLLWDVPLESQQTSSASFGCLAASSGIVAVYGSPAVAGDLVYVAGYNGRIYAFSRDGTRQEPRWVYPRQDTIGASIIGGIVRDQGKLYFAATNRTVYALDAAEGYTEWEYDEIGDKIWSTPAIDGSRLYIGSFDKKLYALDTATGNKEWEYETGGAIVSPPLVYNNAVYFGSFDRYFYAVSTGGSFIWKFMGQNWFWAEAAAYNGTIYAACLDGKVYALDAASGEMKGDYDLGGPVSSAPVIVDGLLVAATEDGMLYTINTATGQQKELVAMEAKVFAALTAGQGKVYVHTAADTLHEVDVRTGAVRDFIISTSEEE